MENEHNMNTKLNDTNVSNCDTEPNKLIKLFYGGSPWQSIDIQVTADLSDVVGHFDFAGTFTMPQLLNCGEYDEAAIELLKQNGVEFYVVQGAELHDWGHLGTVLTVAQSQLDDDGKLEMESLMSVSVTDCAVDSSGEEESAEPDELEAHQTVQRLMTEADDADQRADEAELKLDALERQVALEKWRHKLVNCLDDTTVQPTVFLRFCSNVNELVVGKTKPYLQRLNCRRYRSFVNIFKLILSKAAHIRRFAFRVYNHLIKLKRQQRTTSIIVQLAVFTRNHHTNFPDVLKQSIRENPEAFIRTWWAGTYENPLDALNERFEEDNTDLSAEPEPVP